MNPVTFMVGSVIGIMLILVAAGVVAAIRARQ